MDELAHVRQAIDRLERSGFATVDGGLRPTQGGWECAFAAPLDPEAVRSAVELDDRLQFDEQLDEVFCSHCWTTLYGADAARRYSEHHKRG